MKTSARNQFTGTVNEVIIGAVNAEVHVVLKGGETIVASITKESVENLAIKAGLEVIALVKAPQVIIITDFGGYKVSARNQLPGQPAFAMLPHVRWPPRYCSVPQNLASPAVRYAILAALALEQPRPNSVTHHPEAASLLLAGVQSVWMDQPMWLSGRPHVFGWSLVAHP